MSWSKVWPLIAENPNGGTMPADSDLFSPGYVNDKSTNMTCEAGETLTAKASGGVVIAEEHGEPTYSVTYRIKEMDFVTEKKLIGGTTTGTDPDNPESLLVTSGVVGKEYALMLIPKNEGGIGIKARRTSVSYTAGYSEDEGHYVDITHKILQCGDNEIFTKFRVTQADITLAKDKAKY